MNVLEISAEERRNSLETAAAAFMILVPRGATGAERFE